MKVQIMPCRFPLRDHEWPVLLGRGIQAAGDSVVVSQQLDRSCDAHVFWGMKRAWGKAAMNRDPRRCVVIERAYLGDRKRWHALGIGGLNGRADFNNAEAPPDRWNRWWASEMKPWREGPATRAVVIGQVPGDASLEGADIWEWTLDALEAARRVYPVVYYRPHPQTPYRRVPDGVKTLPGPIHEALAKVDAVITYSSNTAVDAAMAGVPCSVASAMSMANNIASHAVDAPLVRPDRGEWGRKIAYAQWLPIELANGKAWKHIRGGLKT